MDETRTFALEHELEECQRHEGLSICAVCNAFEGELLVYCPGYRLNADALEACYQGNVIDLTRWAAHAARRRRLAARRDR